jgi:RimJ/RimL family protein N-acetyltransferase
VTSPEIRTERLTLDRLRAEDAPALFRYRSDPDVGRYQGWLPGSVDEARSFIADVGAAGFATPGSWFQFAIRHRDSGLLVGDLGVHVLHDEPRNVEIGFTVAPAHQGGGIGTEAVVAVLDHLFGEMGKHRVCASVDPRNVGSIALLRRVGLRQEAHFRESLWFKGEWVDDVIFAILRSEWEHDRPSTREDQDESARAERSSEDEAR